MKLKELQIKNVKSFKEKIRINFNDDFNILIGPNGSGKSNLLDIITICLRQFFLKGYFIHEGNDDRGFFKEISQNDVFGNIHRLNRELEKYYGDSSDSEIIFTFIINNEDIHNISNILSNVETYEKQAGEYRNCPKHFDAIRNWDVSSLKEGDSIAFTINNNRIIQPTGENSHELVFLQYLNYFELILILTRDIPEVVLYPNYLYFSPYRGANLPNLQANLSTQNYYQVLQGLLSATSKTVSSLINLATLYFAEKRRRFEDEALEEGYQTKWDNDEEVKLVTKYLNNLGYSWNLELVDKNKNIYEIILTKEQREFYVNQASSGEKEIINFLLGVFAFHLSNGLIIIDEPELHLHPRWQRVLLDLFIELSTTTKNQFIISTHSPTFINDRSFNNIIRIYKDKNNVSQKVILRDEEELNLKDILHIINSTNNEKLFFADVVVLVEGITDRLIFQRIFTDLLLDKNISTILEIIEVKGKSNQDKFTNFLANLEIPSFFIADLDYINEIGTDEIKNLFVTNENKIEKDVIKNPKSKDGDTLVSQIENAINDESIDELKSLWEYIKSFRRKIKLGLSAEESQLLDDFIESQKLKNVFLLREGDIEDYFPEEYKKKNLDNVISLLSTPNYQSWKENHGKRGFSLLLTIAQEILDKC